ncbi:hypothetical protein IWW43_000659 [Coemansia sp. RSA 1935]|nr:hypothetical protein IWW43_000659 [Coemansia sp. RSA 1935]
MARKRGNSSKKSKRSSVNTSVSTSPVSTPTGLPVESVPVVEENPDSPDQAGGSVVAADVVEDREADKDTADQTVVTQVVDAEESAEQQQLDTEVSAEQQQLDTEEVTEQQLDTEEVTEQQLDTEESAEQQQLDTEEATEQQQLDTEDPAEEQLETKEPTEQQQLDTEVSAEQQQLDTEEVTEQQLDTEDPTEKQQLDTEDPAEEQLETKEPTEQQPPAVSENSVNADSMADNEQPAAPATSADNASESGADGKYNIGALDSVDAIACDTEDQLEELYTYVDNSPTPTDDELAQIIESSDIVRVEGTDSELLVDHNEPDNVQSSVDLEDSEAVLLASNLDDSIYKLETTAKIADEMYAIEQSEHNELAHSSHSDEDEPEMVQSADSVQSDSMSRSYVVSPSVFVAEPEPECVEHIRPVSQAAAVAEPKEDEEADNTPDAVTNTAEDNNDTPTEVINAVDEAIDAPAEVTNTAEENNDAPAGVTNIADENNTSEAVIIYAVEAIEAAAQSMTDSFIHVSKFLDDEKDKAVDIMTNREGSEQVERAVSEVMDNSKDAVNKVSDNTKDASNKVSDNAKDAANKASDKARDAGNKASDKIRDAGDKAEKTAKEAADSTKDAADSASAKARDMGDKAKDAVDSASAKARDVGNKAKDAVDSASAKARDVGDRAKKATADASSRAKDMLDDAGKNVKKAASDANTKAQSAFSKACESGEKLAKRAMDEAGEAEKALEREARETSPTVLRTLGVVAGALAIVSGYYFRLPGRDNQRFGFAGGVASAVIGLGTLATAFIKKNA